MTSHFSAGEAAIGSMLRRGAAGHAVAIAEGVGRNAMNILALVGSQRKSGNTARLVKMIGMELELRAESAGQPLVFETFFLGDMDIRPCRGCRTCFDRGEDKCPLKDDIPAIRAKMDAADALLLASPVYVDDVSGLVKTWMDRLAYLCHRPTFGGKCAYPVATVGGSPTSHARRTMNGALLTWGYHLAGQSGVQMGALDAVRRHGALPAGGSQSRREPLSRRLARGRAAPVLPFPARFQDPATGLAARASRIN